MGIMITGAIAREIHRPTGPGTGPDRPGQPETGHDRGPPPMALLAVAMVVVVGGYLLSVKLRDVGRLEDCLMSGRTNCAPIEQTAGR